MRKLIAGLLSIFLACPNYLYALGLSGDSSGGSVAGGGGGGTTNASLITSGTLADARLTANVTLQGNTFNGVSQLVQLLSNGKLPHLDGSNLFGISASSTVSANAPILGDGSSPNPLRLDLSSVTAQGNAFNGPSQLVQLLSSGLLPVLDGSNLINVPSTPGGLSRQLQYNNGGTSLGGVSALTWDGTNLIAQSDTVFIRNSAATADMHTDGTFGVVFDLGPGNSTIYLQPSGDMQFNNNGGSQLFELAPNGLFFVSNQQILFSATGPAPVSFQQNSGAVQFNMPGDNSIQFTTPVGIGINQAPTTGNDIDALNFINTQTAFSVGHSSGTTTTVTVGGETFTIVGGIITSVNP